MVCVCWRGVLYCVALCGVVLGCEAGPENNRIARPSLLTISFDGSVMKASTYNEVHVCDFLSSHAQTFAMITCESIGISNHTKVTVGSGTFSF